MDQIVGRDHNRSAAEQDAKAESNRSVEDVLGLKTAAGGKKRGRAWIYWTTAAAIVVGGLAYWQFGTAAAAGELCDDAPAERGDITVEVSATGTLQPLIQVDISSELSGVMRSVRGSGKPARRHRAKCSPNSTRHGWRRRSNAPRLR